MKQKIYFMFLLLIFTSCRDLVNITGNFLNTLNNTGNYSFSIIINANSSSGIKIKGLLVYVISPVDSVLLSSAKFTNELGIASINFPEEQINIIPSTSNEILIIAEDAAGTTIIKPIQITSLNTHGLNNLQIYYDIPSDTLKMVSISNYTSFLRYSKNLFSEIK